MINQDQIAAATIAQIFGNELYRAQQSAQTDSGSTPDFVKVHPRDILMGQGNAQNSQARSLQEKHMMEMLQREAEASCPLPASQQLPPQAPQPVPPLPAVPTNVSLPIPPQSFPAVPSAAPGNVWESIAISLERIANRLEAVEITLKKKRIRRK